MTAPSFIGSTAHPVNEPGDPAIYFRREFEVGPGLESATLRVTALGIVEPHLNGSVVGDQVLEPGWTSYRHRLVARRHDITAALQPGVNVFGAIVGEGWATGLLGYEQIARRRQYTDRIMLYAEIELRYPGRTETIGTDERFRAGTGSVRANSLYDGVTIDAPLEPLGWDLPGFDDRAWAPVEQVAWDLDTLTDPIAPPIRRIEELAPQAVWISDRGTTVFDFGQNISGWVRLRVTGTRGQQITVRHSEVLVDGAPDYTTLRTAQATDQYLLAGSGPEHFEPRFTYHGFRYAEIEGAQTSDEVRAVVVHSDMTRTGWFETSDPLLNRLHENVVWSMRDNFVGLPTDCPQRDERLGYTGDINAFATTAAYLYDVSGVLRNWLADLAAEHHALGHVPYVVPDVQHTYRSPTALWSDAAVSVPWTLYQHYGEAEILRASYASMAAFTRSVETLLDDDGVWSSGYQFGDWLDPAAPMTDPRGGRTDPHLVATAYFVKVAQEMAAAAEVLGETGDAHHFGALAGRVRAAFRAEYLTPNGRMAGESVTAYALAIEFGLLEEHELATAGRRLAALVRRDGHRISTGFAGTPHVASALTRTGHTDDAYALVMQRDAPSFLHPVVQGATTVWERWDAILPDGTVNPSGMTSLNHYALGAVAHWLHTVVGGIEATSPGYRTVRIAPQPGGGLTYARATRHTPQGELSVTWRHEHERIDLEVTVPPGTTATVVPPCHPQPRSLIAGSGKHRWSYTVSSDSPPLTLDSPLYALAADPAVWAAIANVLGTDLPPNVLEDLLGDHTGRPLSVALNDYSVISAQVRTRLDTAIRRATAEG
ncbi:family 78 glycoside hydrolase catalytic domain [Actinoplanes sp. NPDC051861]|uniref:alpha-L-rhamnosidase n=1 Tax=Actinoplanes sp. NPDC051861 TaxID=3155170 RepID=UPI0034232962